jgi:hypothetical protein
VTPAGTTTLSVTVPSEAQAIFDWSETNTVGQILEAASDEHQGFLPPFPVPSKGGFESGVVTAGI